MIKTGIINITPTYDEYVFRDADIAAMFQDDPDVVSVVVELGEGPDSNQDIKLTVSFEDGVRPDAMDDIVEDSIIASPLVKQLEWVSSFE